MSAAKPTFPLLALAWAIASLNYAYGNPLPVNDPNGILDHLDRKAPAPSFIDAYACASEATLHWPQACEIVCSGGVCATACKSGMGVAVTETFTVQSCGPKATILNDLGMSYDLDEQEYLAAKGNPVRLFLPRLTRQLNLVDGSYRVLRTRPATFTLAGAPHPAHDVLLRYVGATGGAVDFKATVLASAPGLARIARISSEPGNEVWFELQSFK